MYTTHAERERYDNQATLYSIIISLNFLERAYVRDAVTPAQCAPTLHCLEAAQLTTLVSGTQDIPRYVHDCWLSTRPSSSCWEMTSALWRLSCLSIEFVSSG